jgi:acyl dehydratase
MVADQGLLGEGQAGALVGRTYQSEWLTVSQALVDRFAEVTFDHQYIHEDPVRAAKGPFGGTIAHGFLLLSLLTHLRANSKQPAPADAATRINYGFDRVRFVAPVRVGARIRGRFVVADLVEKRPGQFQQTLDAVIEIEGVDRPAVTARWLTQFVIQP